MRSSSVSSKRAHRHKLGSPAQQLVFLDASPQKKAHRSPPHTDYSLLAGEHIPPFILWRAAAPDWPEKVGLRLFKGGKPIEGVQFRWKIGKRPADVADTLLAKGHEQEGEIAKASP